MKPSSFKIIIILIVALFQLNVKGTEILLYQNDTLYLQKGILSHYVKYDSLSNCIMKLTTNECRKQGFSFDKVIWTIQNNELYLQELNIVDFCTGKEILIPISRFFDVSNNKMHFAKWLSIDIQVGKGDILYYGLEPLYAYGGNFSFSEGMLVNKIFWKNNEVKSRYSNPDTLNSFIYSSINWKIISKRHLKKDYVTRYTIEVNDTGHIENIVLTTSGKYRNDEFGNLISKEKIPKSIKEESLRIVKEIPVWSYYTENGRSYKQLRINLDIIFNEENKNKYAR